MRKLWSKVKAGGVPSIVEFFVSVMSAIAGLLIVCLNYGGFIKLTLDDLVSIVVIILSIIVTSNMLERYGILSDIYGKISAPGGNSAYVTVRKKYEQLHPYDDLVSDVTEIYLLAIANTSFLKGNGLSRLQDAAKKNVKVKLLSLDPEGSLAKEYEASKILSPVSLPLQGNIESYQRGRKTNKKMQACVEMKVCNAIIPYSMMIVKKGNHVKLIKVDLYANDVDYRERRSIIIPPTDADAVNFFLSQWDTLWNDTNNRTIE